MKNRAVPIILALTFIFVSFSLAQNAAKSAKPAYTPATFEEALKNIEAKKAEERKALALKYNNQLKLVTANWLSQREALKKSQLNGAIDQNWDRVPNQYYTNVNNEYYLKGFNYSILNSEIRETESLIAPIKAQVVILEKIYAEKYHTPDMSNIDPYCFTVTSSITLSMEYRQDNFVVTNTDTKMMSMNNNNYPEELKKLRF
jgi:hypothetical protein